MKHLVSRIYGEVSHRTASETATERAVFEQITGELEAVAGNPLPSPGAWGEAIARNMQLWTILSADLMNPQNKLPDEIRQGLLKLGLFVLTHSQEVLSGENELDVLIDINRTIMAGLQDHPMREVA